MNSMFDGVSTALYPGNFLDTDVEWSYFSKLYVMHRKTLLQILMGPFFWIINNRGKKGYSTGKDLITGRKHADKN